MKVDPAILAVFDALDEAKIDYRVGGGQAAVLYGLKDEASDWDLAIEEAGDKLRQVMESQGFTEIADSNGLSWEGSSLLDYIVADGKLYPTLNELGENSVHGIKFVSRPMMGYINWKDGKSAFQELEQYRERLHETGVPPVVENDFDVDWLKKSVVAVRKFAAGLLDQWIQKNVRDPKDHCFFYSGVMAIVFGGQLMRGAPIKEGETAHFWIEKDGEIVDPTIEQYRDIGGYPTYDTREPVDVDKNLDYLVKDELFKTLDSETQEQIKSRMTASIDTPDPNKRGCLMYREIVRLASKLDEAGLKTEASLFDRIVAEAQLAAPIVPSEVAHETEIVPFPTPEVKPVAPVGGNFEKIREEMLFAQVTQQATGVPYPTLKYYLEIAPQIRELNKKLEQTTTMEKGSKNFITNLRQVMLDYMQLDPYNVDAPVIKLPYLAELLSTVETIRQYLPHFDKPDFSEETIVKSMVSQLKEKGYLADLNKLKRSL